MIASETGATAPRLDMTLFDAEGRSHVIADALRTGPVLLGIYKCSCQASKAMLPALERLHQRHAGTPLTVLGVSQDSANITRSFARRYNLTFPLLVEPEGYPVSRAFEITATPTVYLIRPDGALAFTTMGFFRGPINELGDAVATLLGQEQVPLAIGADPFFVPG